MGRYFYYDIVLPQTVGDGIDINSRVIFNGIDVGAVQSRRFIPTTSASTSRGSLCPATRQ